MSTWIHQTSRHGWTVLGLLSLVACSSEPTEGASNTNGSLEETGTDEGIAMEESGTGDVGVETEGGETTSLPTACEPNQGDCSNPTPICGAEGTCEACETDPQCTSAHPSTPACNEGSCVECTAANDDACELQTPICNTDLLTCEACTSDEQCQALQETNCNLSTGACFSDSPAATISVRPNPGPDDVTTLQEALNRLADLNPGPEGGTIILFPGASDNPYLEGSLTIDFNLDLQAADATTPVIQGAGGPSLVVAAGVSLRIEGVQISGNLASSGIEVQDGASLNIIRDVTISNNAGVGIQANGGTLDITQSRIINNDAGGITLSDGASMSLVNSFVAQLANETNAVELIGSSAEVIYSTLMARNIDFDGDAFAFVCDDESTLVDLRNSFLFAIHDEPEFRCPSADVTFSASETLVDGDGNVSVGDVQPEWFEGIAVGNLDLSEPPDDLLTTARWEEGDPTIDINGDSRFSGTPTPGTPDVAGADSLSPVEVTASP